MGSSLCGLASNRYWALAFWQRTFPFTQCYVKVTLQLRARRQSCEVYIQVYSDNRKNTYVIFFLLLISLQPWKQGALTRICIIRLMSNRTKEIPNAVYFGYSEIKSLLRMLLEWLKHITSTDTLQNFWNAVLFLDAIHADNRSPPPLMHRCMLSITLLAANDTDKYRPWQNVSPCY